MIVFMGVAGAGKSVQGKLLADDLGYRWLSTGEFLRMHITGKRRDEMLEGKLLDDQEIIDILKPLFESNSDNKCILDGFPRTLKQAEWLITQHEQGVVDISAVLHLQASEDVVKERLLARGRPDDTEEAIIRRFEEYQTATLPIVDWFKNKDIPVYEINGERSVEEIHEDIMSKVKSLNVHPR